MPKKVKLTNLTSEFEVGPEFLAQVFSELDSGEQAQFFNVLAGLVAKWRGDPNSQWLRMSDELTPQGRELLASMGSYAWPEIS